MNKLTGFLAGVFLLAVVSCDEGNPLDAGWSKFAEGDYPGAHAEFSSLVGSEGAGAYVGLGWTTMKMDSLPEADNYFALAAADSLPEGFAGWSILAWLQGNHTACIDRAEFVFRVVGGYDTYVFPYDPSITYQDLLLHEAYSYYYQQDFFNCVNCIQMIDPSFAVAMNDPTLQAKLLDELQKLMDTYL